MDTISSPPAAGSCVLRDALRDCWLLFPRPAHIHWARSAAEVSPLLLAVQSQVEKEGVYAAGFLSYEAAPAFDEALTVKTGGDFPLAWFGIYEEPVSISLPIPSPSVHPAGLPWTPSINRDRYEEALEQIKGYIQEGHTYQVNFTIRLRAAFAGDPWAIFLAMIQAQPKAYGAYLNTDAWSLASASPELFFQQTPPQLQCRPMKGTAARGLTCASDLEARAALQRSDKNRAENLMIVDMVRNDLGRIARPGTIHADDLFRIEKYRTLWQMTSAVRCQTDASLPEVMRALFPPASITGAPKPRTMEIIAELEDSPRRIYTGAIGFLTPARRAQFNVAIRTVLVDKSTRIAEYGVGGGIVWDSCAADEFEECLTKARIVTQRQPAFSLLESLLWTPQEGFFLLGRHLRRLQESADYFDFPVSISQIQARLRELARSLPEQSHKVRLLLSPQGVPSIQGEPIARERPGRPLRVRVAPWPVDITDVLLHHKTTHREVYEKAARACPGCDEVLLWNDKGELTEACNANLVVEIAGQRYTPPVTSGLLAGTYRNWLLARNKVSERVVHRSDLDQCSRLFLINSVRKQREARIISP